MTQTVKAVGFSFIGPEAVRVFLMVKHHPVYLYDGEELPELSPDATNFVIVPNFERRHELVELVPHIHRLILYPGEKTAQDLAAAGVPLLDTTFDGDEAVQRFPNPRPVHYVQEMEDLAAAIKIGEQPKPKTQAAKAKKTAPKGPTPETANTIDEWIDVLDKYALRDVEIDLTVEVEYPVCQFVVGEAGLADLQNSLKPLARRAKQHGGDPNAVIAFYLWMKDRGEALSAAAQALLAPEGTEVPDARTVATAHKVSEYDLVLIEAIYKEMRGEADAGQDGQDD